MAILQYFKVEDTHQQFPNPDPIHYQSISTQCGVASRGNFAGDVAGTGDQGFP